MVISMTIENIHREVIQSQETSQLSCPHYRMPYTQNRETKKQQQLDAEIQT